ncbi:MAG: HAD hydrolase-like protein, partial [Mycobacterium sp.]|nr:HAD hydrolase-like protein [Mycobacterium sp.]
MVMVRVDAAIFDLFETLVTEFDPGWRLQPSTASRLGVPETVFNDMWRSRHIRRMTSVIDFRDVLRDVCSAAGTVIDARIDKIIEDLYAERLVTKAKPLIAVDPRISQALEQLRAGGIKLGLISNCSVEEVASWPESPLASVLDSVVFSYRVGMAKPHREIYLHTCRML